MKSFNKNYFAIKLNIFDELNKSSLKDKDVKKLLEGTLESKGFNSPEFYTVSIYGLFILSKYIDNKKEVHSDTLNLKKFTYQLGTKLKSYDKSLPKYILLNDTYSVLLILYTLILTDKLEPDIISTSIKNIKCLCSDLKIYKNEKLFLKYINEYN